MTNETPVQVQPDQLITVTLQAQHWQVVMGAVQELPYRIANPVVVALSQQFSVTLAEQQQPLKNNGNGADYEIPKT